MSHKHENLIRTIFQDPISGNIHWREIESLLHHLGASVEPIQGARYRVVLNGIVVSCTIRITAAYSANRTSRTCACTWPPPA